MLHESFWVVRSWDFYEWHSPPGQQEVGLVLPGPKILDPVDDLECPQDAEDVDDCYDF